MEEEKEIKREDAADELLNAIISSIGKPLPIKTESLREYVQLSRDSFEEE